MIKIIELPKNGAGRLNNYEPFLLPDNLVFKFLSQGYNFSTAFIYLRNGTVNGKYKFESEFTVPKEYLFGGKLEIAVRINANGEYVKTWNILPITIVETDEGLQGYDELESIKKKHTLLVKKVNEIAEKQNEMSEILKEIKEKLKEI